MTWEGEEVEDRLGIGRRDTRVVEDVLDVGGVVGELAVLGRGLLAQDLGSRFDLEHRRMAGDVHTCLVVGEESMRDSTVKDDDDRLAGQRRRRGGGECSRDLVPIDVGSIGKYGSPEGEEGRVETDPAVESDLHATSVERLECLKSIPSVGSSERKQSTLADTHRELPLGTTVVQCPSDCIEPRSCDESDRVRLSSILEFDDMEPDRRRVVPDVTVNVERGGGYRGGIGGVACRRDLLAVAVLGLCSSRDSNREEVLVECASVVEGLADVECCTLLRGLLGRVHLPDKGALGGERGDHGEIERRPPQRHPAIGRAEILDGVGRPLVERERVGGEEGAELGDEGDGILVVEEGASRGYSERRESIELRLFCLFGRAMTIHLLEGGLLGDVLLVEVGSDGSSLGEDDVLGLERSSASSRLDVSEEFSMVSVRSSLIEVLGRTQ